MTAFSFRYRRVRPGASMLGALDSGREISPEGARAVYCTMVSAIPWSYSFNVSWRAKYVGLGLCKVGPRATFLARCGDGCSGQSGDCEQRLEEHQTKGDSHEPIRRFPDLSQQPVQRPHVLG